MAAVNPWRENRLPDRFPAIVQDAMVIGLFALIAALVLQERVFATTAVGAVVVGFALQDTLGNLFAGLAIQIEKPFRVGHWVGIGGIDGQVTEVTWRATRLRTRSGHFVVVPNSSVGKEVITNYSEPTRENRMEIQVGVSYDAAPNTVKAVILDALRDDPLFSGAPPPEVVLAGFDASAIAYDVYVWTTEFAFDYRVRDRIRSRIYYALRRHGISIPYPIQVEQRGEPAPPPPAGPAVAALASVAILAPLTEAQRLDLVETGRRLLFARGEAIVREGEAGSSMFVLVAGEASVTLAGAEGELRRLGAGDFFGEMSLLTGAPRSATVSAASDCDVLEIGVDSFRRLILGEPSMVDAVASAVSLRRAELERHRTERVAGASVLPEAPHSLLARVRQFLGLSPL
ncbi:MAG: mechanosensitive ion channel [Acidobacteria bacterium]|nr:mechanosensitive ion channel [Acidobacteriota bacterium]